MPKIKKPSRSSLVKKLDTVFSQWIRFSNADSNGFCICITCEKKSHWKEIQAGHFMSRKHYSTRWDERNVKPQCVGCNVFRYGEQYKFSKMLGIQLSNELEDLSRSLVKFSNNELNDMIKNYSIKLKKLI
tara:strand:+ start:369 stop:758 length:390 start_codon:yes stop_codon:yes gene_type:complete